MTLQYVRLQNLLQTQAWRLVLLYSCCPAWQANRCRKDRNVIGMLLHAGTTPILCLRRNHPRRTARTSATTRPCSGVVRLGWSPSWGPSLGPITRSCPPL